MLVVCVDTNYHYLYIYSDVIRFFSERQKDYEGGESANERIWIANMTLFSIS